MEAFVNKSELIRFIFNEVDTHPSSVVTRAAIHFRVSRQRVQYTINELLKSKVLAAKGKTRARKYSLARQLKCRKAFETRGLAEDQIFTSYVAPQIQDVPRNVYRVCNYGFTEILNNAIDHSLSEMVVVEVHRSPCMVEFVISDGGVGIFAKIKAALDLEDERHSLLELFKGKLTTDRSRHSGEGIFFTSRAFDHFSLLSGKLFFWHRTNHDDWLLEDRAENHSGTHVTMRICTHSNTNMNELFDKFTSETDGMHAFSKTHVPIALAQYGDGNLVSRSQAKRVLARFDQFQEVMLDFHAVTSIGQAFADEIFRVFRLQNPAIKVAFMNANVEVMSMITRATAAYDQDMKAKTSDEK